MSKYDKEQGILKPADIKKIEPTDKTKRSHHKKKFPQHWEIRKNHISSSKLLKKSDWDWQWEKVKKEGSSFVYYKTSEEYHLIKVLLNNNSLDEALAIYAKHHPETINWPVRFINVQPMNTTREIL